MDYQQIINLVLGTVLATIGWFARQLWDATQNLKSDIQKIEIELPTSYVRKDDMSQRFDRIEMLLDKLFEKLENKVDK